MFPPRQECEGEEPRHRQHPTASTAPRRPLQLPGEHRLKPPDTKDDEHNASRVHMYASGLLPSCEAPPPRTTKKLLEAKQKARWPPAGGLGGKPT